jgi:hypothetical protein
VTAPGTQRFTYLQSGKETVAGTAVAATRPWYPDGSGFIDIDPMLMKHGGNRGTRTALAYVTSQGVMVEIPFKSHADRPIAYDELIYLGSQLKGGVSGTGGAADKTWIHAPSQTGANAQESFTLEAGDDVQGWQFPYGQMTDWTLSASNTGMTDAQANWFAQQPVKASKTSLTANQAVMIPGYLWKMRFAAAQSGLSGATDNTVNLIDWNLNVVTGLVRRKNMTGSPYFDRTVEAADISGVLTLHVESTAAAVSEFYDKFYGEIVDFAQLKAVGPTLGGSNYSSQIQMALIYTMVKPISAADQGVNLYEITAELTADPTWNQSIAMTTVCSATAY